MKWTVLFCMFVGGLSVGAGTAPTVSDVRAQQRWPWNALVDIDYTLGGDTDGLAVEISVKDRATGTIHRPMTYLEKPSSSVGAHRVTWDSHADGVTGISTDMVATVSLLRFPLVTPSPKGLYCVVDLSGGVNAVRFPVTSLSGVPKGGWKLEHKTDKLVLRRIEPGTFLYGGRTRITISQPFYIGVFEMTRSQCRLIMGDRPHESAYYNILTDEVLPASGVAYSWIRGALMGTNSLSAVDATSFLGVLREKTGLDGFDLPTEAQWEYSCRAGTTSDFNNGGDGLSAMVKVGWTRDTYDLERRGDRITENENSLYTFHYSGYPVEVGRYQPNAWGLYDMHGNVAEWCLNWRYCLNGSEYPGDSFVDPVGDNSDYWLRYYSQQRYHNEKVLRGGCFTNEVTGCTSSARHCKNSLLGYGTFGFRIILPAGQ